MATNKKSFLFYVEWIESFEDLTDKEAGQLIKHILLYVNDESPELTDRLLKQAFIPIKQQLKTTANTFNALYPYITTHLLH